MDDPASRQPEAGSRLGLAGRAAAERGARGVEVVGTGRPVDGAVDPPATGERLVGGVHDGVDVLPGNVAAHRLDPHAVTLCRPPKDATLPDHQTLRAVDSSHFARETRVWACNDPLIGG